jgi:tetratricopeptide (TPR) repeat protein
MAPSTIQTLLLGGFGLISVSFLFYFLFWKKPALAIKDKDDDSKAKDSKQPTTASSKEASSSKVAPSTKSVATSPAPVAKAAEVIVEDADDSDSDDEGSVASEVDAEAEAIKEQYEDASRLASKLIAGQRYDKAIEKLSEAIELSPKVPSAGKDLITLYNNRSAMYEKTSNLDKSLSDIMVVLTMDVCHLKARVRRARIYEAQVGDVEEIPSV